MYRGGSQPGLPIGRLIAHALMAGLRDMLDRRLKLRLRDLRSVGEPPIPVTTESQLGRAHGHEVVYWQAGDLPSADRPAIM